LNDFEHKVLTELANIGAKMDMLVGADGTNGRFSEIVSDVEELKQDRSRRGGFIAAIGLGATAVGAAADWLFRK
jgi:hypothetical protein